MGKCKTCGGGKIKAFLNKAPAPAGIAKPNNIATPESAQNEPPKKIIYKRVNGRLITEVVDDV